MPVLGHPTPSRFMPPTVGPSFPHVPAQASDLAGTIVVPPGALDRWFAYRATKGATRREVVVFGDSTTYGSEGSGTNYSWLQRLRDRLTGLGFADGGKGIFAGGENLVSYDSPEINGFVSSTFGGGFADAFDNLGGQYYYDTGSPAGHTLTLQFKGTACRVWYSGRYNAGDFTYAIDGGAPVTVHANDQTVNASRFAWVEGLADTTHTIVITNLGGRAATPPATTVAAQNSPGSGTLTSATYYYVATHLFGGGETLAGPVASVAVGGSGRSVGISVSADGQDSTMIYRSTSPTGPFEFVTSTRVGGTTTVDLFTDDGSVTPAVGQNPPGTGTTNLNTSSPLCWIALAPQRATGVALEKQATSGGTLNTFFVINTAMYWTALGLTYNGSDMTLASSYPVDTRPPVAGRINPVLAMFHLGFNDLSAQSTTDYSAYTTAIARFAAACSAAGCDGIVLSGQLPYNANWPTYGPAIYAAMKAQALSRGLAFADIFTPVGGPSLSYAGGVQNPHLFRAQYVAQADWLWDNLLGVTT